MNNHELITVPENMKVPVTEVNEVLAQTPIEMPEHIRVTAEAPQETIAVDVIEQAPFNVEVYQIPHMKLGKEVVKGLITVPGANPAEIIESGTPVAGQTRGVVHLGGLDDYKGGNPGNVIGFDGIVRK